VLRKIFGPEREEDRSWGKLHNNELHGLQSSPNFVTVIISRRKRWAEHVAHMGRGGAFKGFWLGGQKGRHHWEDQGVDERITFRWTLRTPGSMG
jgi:hypothetical protein